MICKEYLDGKIKLYNCDCLELMKQLDEKSIDAVITDCPYKIIAGGIRIEYRNDECSGILNKRDWSKTDPKGCLNRGKIVISDGTNCSNKWLKKDNLSTPSAVKDGKMFSYNDIQFSEWLPDIFKILKTGTHCYIMVNGRNLKDLQVECEKVGFEYQNLLVWDKNSATPNKYYMNGTEFILMLSKRPARNINDMGIKNIFRIPNIIGKKKHPTEKPVPLMDIMVLNSSNQDELVFDPFMGAGAVGLSCIKLNRRFIGCEIDFNYFEVACERIELEMKQPNFFNGMNLI